jgi:hypothetical protein
MIYKAYSSDTNKLLSLPETGMGYQVVEGELPSHEVRRFVVYNCELVVDLDADFSANKRMIVENRLLLNLKEKPSSWGVLTDSIRLISRKETIESRYLNENKKNDKKRHPGGKGATENPKEFADGKEIFVRISAFEDDIRIDSEKKKLKDGAYTTTHTDYLECVYSNDDPIDRYALPSDDTIKWSFYIQPKSIDVLQRGIVQPAFSHDGGGVEVFFEKGTSENTLFDKKPYGK